MENKNLKIGDSIREAKDAELREKLNTTETPEAPKAPEAPKPLTGKVTGCNCLNIRNAGNLNAKIVAVIGAGSTVTIDKSKSTPDWYYVTTEDNIEGFCMKSYITEDK